MTTQSQRENKWHSCRNKALFYGLEGVRRTDFCPKSKNNNNNNGKKKDARDWGLSKNMQTWRDLRLPWQDTPSCKVFLSKDKSLTLAEWFRNDKQRGNQDDFWGVIFCVKLSWVSCNRCANVMQIVDILVTFWSMQSYYLAACLTRRVLKRDLTMLKINLLLLLFNIVPYLHSLSKMFSPYRVRIKMSRTKGCYTKIVANLNA